jgi:hypothetical protein
MAFQLVYEDGGDGNESVVKWKVVDYEPAGEIPYL